MSLRIGSLFSGYGGLDLAAEAFFGAETAWHVEFDKAPSRILEARWPGVPNLGDVTSIDWSQVEPVDILTGGFPCQDLSLAGRRKGMRTGTRSGLWSDFVRAIEALKPGVVVIENVRGLLSGCAESDLGPCPGCMGDGRHEPVLRALGRVLGDLADLGFDAEWAGIRASDIGAPHNRFRVFVLAYRPGVGHEWAASEGLGRAGSALGGGEAPEVDRLFDTPDTMPDAPNSSSNRVSQPAGLGNQVAALFRTPAAAEAEGGPRNPDRPGATMRLTDQVREEQGRGVLVPISSADLLPTPVVNDMGDGKTLEWWDEWAPRQKASDGTKASHGRSLAVEALRTSAGLLPTPRASEGEKGGPNMRGSKGDLMLSSAVPGLLPTTTAKDADSSRGSSPRNVTLNDAADALAIDWGKYEGAVRRWESITRPAPAPTRPDGRDGQHRLAAEFAEWMMGIPAGWVTDPALGLSRREQLKACGNGVVPQQAVAALAGLWARATEEVAA